MDKTITVTLGLSAEKKHSVKFFTAVAGVSFDNLYIKKDEIPANTTGVRVTVEFLTA